jgi:predicted permease
VNQIALSLLLLVAAGLFVRTLHKLNSVELGFNREHLLLFGVNPRQTGYRDQALTQLLSNLQQRFAEIPGVRSATASDIAMVSHSVNSGSVTILGAGSKEGDASFLSVSSDFFRTMEIPLLLGRPIDERDVANGTRNAVVSELFVKNHLGGQSPLGRQFTTERGGRGVQIEIVGVAANTRYSSLKGALVPVVYLPYTYQRSIGGLTFELRSAGDPIALAGVVREIVRRADSRIPVTDIRTQDAVINQTIGQERTFATLCIAFALLAVAIAGVGLYGTMSYSVARRTNEIGLRMALGAERPKLIWMVLREVFVMAAVGLAIGLPVALLTTKFVKAFLFETTPNDPWAITGAAVLLVLVAVGAGFGPALRASRVDPWSALRHD